jgi:hypothetical protein
MNYENIKPETLDGIRRYVDDHCPPGDFLEAVLSNDLKESCWRADDANLETLIEIVHYCYNMIPSVCWGSPEKVRNWLARLTPPLDIGFP